jgi:hypothetical protein
LIPSFINSPQRINHDLPNLCRCLAETESHCPTCARSHGVIQEIRRNNERFAGEHEIFLEEVRESEDGFATIAAAYGKGIIGLAKSN